MDNTIIQQGTFTKADTSNVTLSLRSDIDWIKVYNRTQIGATNNVGVEFYWQREMIANGHGGFVTAKYGGLDAVEMQNLAVGSFIPLNTSLVAPGAAIATTGTTNATQPVVSTATTTGLATGSIVRLIDNTNQNNIAGFDFEIDTIVAGVSFRMAATLANVVGGAGGNGFYRLIPYEPMFYPRWRTIVNITQAASAVVTASVRHGYTVGQEIRFVIPEAAWGMVELNGLVGTITAVTTLTFTVNINTTGFTAFSFPLIASFPFAWALSVPVGEDTAAALTAGTNILADATRNTSIIGITLAGGADFPGGDTNDVMYWVAGKSFATNV